MRIIFMGTPDFSVPTLRALCESRHEVVGVYTQPDKEKGRGKKLIFSPVKEYALSEGLPVFQPVKLKDPEVLREMEALRADAMVVVAYGKILRPEVLHMTKYGCFNVHASLLPSYRGAAPIQWAILRGETETGVTIMQMDEGIDTGDILNTVKIPIDPEDTGDSLFEKLSVLGGAPLLKTLDEAEEGCLHPVKQGEMTTPYASMLTKDFGKIDWKEDAHAISLKIRGLNSWPSAYTYFHGKMLKIWKGKEEEGDGTPGTVSEVTKHGFSVAAGKGRIRILELQPEGKKRMDADAFLRGYEIREGDTLGE